MLWKAVLYLNISKLLKKDLLIHLCCYVCSTVESLYSSFPGLDACSFVAMVYYKLLVCCSKNTWEELVHGISTSKIWKVRLPLWVFYILTIVYISSYSKWGFHLLRDLSLDICWCQIQENDGVPNIEDSHASIKEERHDASGRFTERMLSEMVNHSNTVSGQEVSPILLCKRVIMMFWTLYCKMVFFRTLSGAALTIFLLINIIDLLFQDALNDLHDLKSSLASFPMKPLQALKYDCVILILFHSPSCSFSFPCQTLCDSCFLSIHIPLLSREIKCHCFSAWWNYRALRLFFSMHSFWSSRTIEDPMRNDLPFCFQSFSPFTGAITFDAEIVLMLVRTM